MAKDVDLSSKEWRDLIFEGKNKDFGAYKLRQGSESLLLRSYWPRSCLLAYFRIYEV